MHEFGTGNKDASSADRLMHIIGARMINMERMSMLSKLLRRKCYSSGANVLLLLLHLLPCVSARSKTKHKDKNQTA